MLNWVKLNKTNWRNFGLILLILLAAMINGLGHVEAAGESDGIIRRVRVPILMYHYISTPPVDADKYRLDLSVTPDHFRQQMEWLKTHNYHPIHVSDLAAAMTRGRKLPENPVLITFDDGYVDAYTEAFPVLRDLGFSGTFFIVTDWIDEHDLRYLTWSQIKEMADAGMDIQSHSRRHYDMRNHNHDWLVYEILGPMQTIEAHTGIRPIFFCYPGGQFDETVVIELRAVGVIAAFTTNDGTYNYTDNMLRLPRVRIRGSTTLTTFAELVNWQR